ncbi:MAG TPA: hypothetical protein VLH79_09755 [Chthonomonadales bacterium]|nr:hypothetical protein [Chthonomonadales bacterium]
MQGDTNAAAMRLNAPALKKVMIEVMIVSVLAWLMQPATREAVRYVLELYAAGHTTLAVVLAVVWPAAAAVPLFIYLYLYIVPRLLGSFRDCPAGRPRRHLARALLHMSALAACLALWSGGMNVGATLHWLASCPAVADMGGPRERVAFHLRTTEHLQGWWFLWPR